MRTTDGNVYDRVTSCPRGQNQIQAITEHDDVASCQDGITSSCMGVHFASSILVTSTASSKPGPLSNPSLAVQSREEKRARLQTRALCSAADPVAGVLSLLGLPALGRCSARRDAASPTTQRPGS